MARRDRVADAAFHFRAEDEGMQQRCAAEAMLLCERQRRWCDRRRRMDHRIQMRVVVVNQVRGDRVHERRPHRIQPLRPANHGQLRGTAELPHDRDGSGDGWVVGHAQRAAEEIEQRTLGLVPWPGIEVGPRGVRHKAAQRLADGTAVACVAAQYITMPASATMVAPWT